MVARFQGVASPCLPGAHGRYARSFTNAELMTEPIRLHYRITSHGGMLYVRELLRGEIVGRFVNSKSTRIATSSADIVADCSSVFDGAIESIEQEDDVVYVTCTIEPS